MPFTNFPFGVTSFGIPQMGAMPISIPSGQRVSAIPAGKIWFVDAGNTGGMHTGVSPDEAFLTIQQALNAAGNGTGDSIFVYPGTYAEVLTVTKDYIGLYGAQFAGFARPDVVPLAGVALTVTGQGFCCAHIRFASLLLDCVIQEGNGFSYQDCVFDGDGTATKAGIRLIPSATITSKTASEGQILNNYFRGNAIGIVFDTAAPAVGVGSTDNWIAYNRFSRNTLDLATADSGAASTYSVQFTVIGPGNQFEDKNKATYIDFTTANGGPASAQSGAINDNTFALDAGGATAPTTTQFKMVGTAFTFSGNYGTIDVMNGSGLD